MTITLKPRLGRVPVGNKNVRHFQTANVCLNVKSPEAIVRVQKLLDEGRGLQGEFTYYRAKIKDNNKYSAENLREIRSRRGVGKPPAVKVEPDKTPEGTPNDGS